MLLLLSWVVWIVAAVVLNLVMPWQSRLPAVLADMLTYGKLKGDPAWPRSSPANSSSRSSSVSRLNRRFFSTISYLMHILNSVPRRYFTHFYVWGCIWNFFLLVSFIFRNQIPSVGVLVNLLTGTPVPTHGRQWSQQQMDVFLALILLFLQTLRRLVECILITEHSDRKMHAIHYVLGLYFYSAVGPTALLHLSKSDGLIISTSFLQFIRWRHVAAIVLFIWASYHQFTCHVILADLRKGLQLRQQYREERTVDIHDTSSRAYSLQVQADCSVQRLSVGIPVEDWFKFVSCPHYFAEVLIYCSLLLVEWGSFAMVFPCVFVLSVLILSARQMHSWYCSKFDDYPRSRKRIFPYLF